jgi:hypothetical protein
MKNLLTRDKVDSYLHSMRENESFIWVDVGYETTVQLMVAPFAPEDERYRVRVNRELRHTTSNVDDAIAFINNILRDR